MSEHGHDHHHEHGHDHGDDGTPPAAGERGGAAHRALEALLVEKGLVSTDAIDAVIDLYVNDVGPQNGAQGRGAGVGRPAYRERLLRDGPRRSRDGLRRRGGPHDGGRGEHARGCTT